VYCAFAVPHHVLVIGGMEINILDLQFYYKLHVGSMTVEMKNEKSD
jgi:hypothetical protein